MADDDQNLVSEIKVVGADESTDQIKKFSDEGAAALDKLANSANKASNSVNKATGDMGKGFDDAGKKAADLPSKLTAIVTAASNLGGAVRTSVNQVAKLGASITAVAAAGVAGVVGIAKFASSVTASVREVNRANDANAELVAQQKKGNQQVAQNIASAAQYQSQIRQLNNQVATGKIGYEEYSSALQDLNTNYQESVRVQREVQQAQDDALKSNQALERQAANRAAFDDLAKTYGTTLTGSLIKLGAAYDNVRDQTRDAFGPVIASLVDRITTLIDKNSGAITKFIDQAAAALQKFFTENGPAFEKLITQIGEIGAAFVKVVVSIVIPALQRFMSFLDSVASAINSIFGTDINGAFLAVVLLLGTLSGAFSAVGTVISLITTAVAALVAAFSPLVIVVGLLVVAFAALAASIDWTAFGQRAVAAGSAILGFFTSIPKVLGDLFAAFFQFMNDGFTAVATAVLAAWQAVVDFFNALISTLQDIFTQIGETIKNAFNSALNFVVQLFTSWSQKIMGYIQPIIDALNRVKTLLSQTGSTSVAVGAVGAAGGGHIRGPGTSTSDSIPAWLSNNEFVIRAKAVAKYGVGFLNLLNSGKLDLGKIAGYAMGGLVSMPRSPSLSFADGGLVQGGPRTPDKILNLTIGGETFAGLLMPDDIASSMTRFAVARNSRSAGRRPGWVGGKR